MRRYVFATGLPECQLQVDAIMDSVSEHAANGFAGHDLDVLNKYLGVSEVGDWMQSVDRYGRHVLILRSE